METMPYLAIRSAASLIVLERGFVRNYPLDAKNLWRIGRKNPETEKYSLGIRLYIMGTSIVESMGIFRISMENGTMWKAEA